MPDDKLEDAASTARKKEFRRELDEVEATQEALKETAKAASKTSKAADDRVAGSLLARNLTTAGNIVI